jgi:hypothetical protein
MARIKLILRVFVGAIAFLVYVWFAAVRDAPAVMRRKAERRAARSHARAAARLDHEPAQPPGEPGDAVELTHS